MAAKRKRGQKPDCPTISLAYVRVKCGASKGSTEPAEIRTGPSFCTNTSQDGEQSIQKNSRMDQGYLHTDGYTGYRSLLEEIIVVGCWAHLRRKFDEAMKSLSKGKARGSSAAQGLAYCDFLFKLEDSWTELPPEERYDQRLEQAKPVLDAMLAWTNTRIAAPKSALGRAFTYLKEQWPYLTSYLKDGRLRLSNSRAERNIVIDRKNFLFADTPKGGTGSAIMFSIIQASIENGLNPYRYLTWLLKTANNADLKDPNIVESLLPWNVPEKCIAYTK